MSRAILVHPANETSWNAPGGLSLIRRDIEHAAWHRDRRDTHPAEYLWFGAQFALPFETNRVPPHETLRLGAHSRKRTPPFPENYFIELHKAFNDL
jgi:hypothetical protein